MCQFQAALLAIFKTHRKLVKAVLQLVMASILPAEAHSSLISSLTSVLLKYHEQQFFLYIGHYFCPCSFSEKFWTQCAMPIECQ
jgi:hypothetical protein